MLTNVDIVQFAMIALLFVGLGVVGGKLSDFKKYVDKHEFIKNVIEKINSLQINKWNDNK